ncbi:MAG: CBS domain-containing protein [Paracoccus sp. (in: a-proteobacteria)]|uniref:CBS domain-containing protein n=1 Tax=Paracoccus sp. TaxID=267 RepID=UPI0026E0C659|nr:CBS domain-containing protein [Paracoccus sp. (in: a-proteobacteria)]MDO5611779.1 CBS domain-containing protein [Paracoccus sp. (in: a-proteobacteria)]
MTMTSDSIGTIMRRDFPRLSADMPIRDAAALMLDQGFAAAPVVDDAGALIGVLTQKDCFRPALNASYYRQWSGTVADQMSRTPVTLEAATDPVTAAQAFLDHPHRSFPVMRDGQLAGLLLRADLLAYLLRLG